MLGRDMYRIEFLLLEIKVLFFVYRIMREAAPK